jgi:hypothetical protein
MNVHPQEGHASLMKQEVKATLLHRHHRLLQHQTKNTLENL